jgi:hypothetical protein
MRWAPCRNSRGVAPSRRCSNPRPLSPQSDGRSCAPWAERPRSQNQSAAASPRSGLAHVRSHPSRLPSTCQWMRQWTGSAHTGEERTGANQTRTRLTVSTVLHAVVALLSERRAAAVVHFSPPARSLCKKHNTKKRILVRQKRGMVTSGRGTETSDERRVDGGRRTAAVLRSSQGRVGVGQRRGRTSGAREEELTKRGDTEVPACRCDSTRPAAGTDHWRPAAPTGLAPLAPPADAAAALSCLRPAPHRRRPAHAPRRDQAPRHRGVTTRQPGRWTISEENWRWGVERQRRGRAVAWCWSGGPLLPARA